MMFTTVLVTMMLVVFSTSVYGFLPKLSPGVIFRGALKAHEQIVPAVKNGFGSGFMESLTYELSNGLVKEVAGDAPELIEYAYTTFISSVVSKIQSVGNDDEAPIGNCEGPVASQSSNMFSLWKSPFVQSVARGVVSQVVMHSLVHTISAEAVHAAAENFPLLATALSLGNM